jgi:hypothetical protein
MVTSYFLFPQNMVTLAFSYFSHWIFKILFIYLFPAQCKLSPPKKENTMVLIELKIHK